MYKEEAVKAIRQVIEALAGPEDIAGLRRFQLRAALEYAAEQVDAIQELRRARKVKEPT